MREEQTQFAVLVVNPDQDQGQEICATAQALGIHARLVSSHWQALALTEDENWPCLVVAVQGLDISGLEFCALLRAREARRQSPSAYVIVLGVQSDLPSVVSTETVIDAYLLEPWLDLELTWQFKRAERFWHLFGKISGALVDPSTGLLTPDGLKSFLFQEVNRVGRRRGWFSLSILAIANQGELRASFGVDWLAWFISGAWDYLRCQLRNYDRLAILGEGRLGLVSPDLDEHGTKALLVRLQASLHEYNFQDRGSQRGGLDFCAQYLCVQVLGSYKQFERSGTVLWSWLQDQVDRSPPVGVHGAVGRIGLELETKVLGE